ncbi:unnamed protein product [Alopecurus aequalis]
MPLPRSRRGPGRGRASSTSPPPTHRRGRGSSAVPPPTRRLVRGWSAVPPPTRRLDCADCLFDHTLRPDRDCHGQRTPSKEKHVAEPASAQTLQQLDVLSLKDLCYTTTMEGLSTTTASLPSPHYTIEASPTSERRLSSSPIWKRRDFEWAITFYTIEDRRGYFHTFPQVGFSFQSKDEANKAIDRYLTNNRSLTMGMGLSEVDKLIVQHRYFPDGTKRRLKAGQPIDKKRDTNYQLVQALLYKYNDHHNLTGDLAYEFKDVLDEPKYWEEPNYRMYIHMNFTAKTKGSDGFDTGSDNLFFAEVTCQRGDGRFVVNCCCMVKPFDNGRCIGCGTTMKTTIKHPSDRSAYTGGQMNASCSRPFGSFPAEATWVYEEDSDEEVERLRSMFEGRRATPRVPLEA